MLKLILSPLVELSEHFFDGNRATFIADVVEGRFLKVVSHDRKRLRLRRCRYLPDEVVTELVLDTWLV